MKRNRRFAVLPFAFPGILLSSPAKAQLKPGDTLGKENWQAAKGLMPESILHRFEDGGYRAKVIASPDTMSFGYYKEAYDKDGQLWRMVLNSVSVGRTEQGDFL